MYLRKSAVQSVLICEKYKKILITIPDWISNILNKNDFFFK